tara:strand:+ start:14998 stop:15924 length:927 start_codon:yes stop_codon:yes gene_type:complete
MRAIIFPGQGSQKVGMATEFEKNFQIVKDIFKQADDILKFKLSEIILRGSDDELKKTEITQPAILTTSFAIFTVLKDEFNFNLSNVKFLAGHSLGEYSALVASGSLSFKDAISLVHRRGKLMQEAVPLGQGSMLAVMGIENNELKELINKFGKKNGVCEIANDNAKGQIIISGEKIALNKFNEVLKEKKRRSVFLPVSAPFHCSLMKSAANEMDKLLQNIEFENAQIQLISNVTALPLEKKEDIAKLLFEQIFSPVRWRESIEYMIKKGITDFIEIGPGKVLSGLVKRTNDKVKIDNINDVDDIKNLK